MGYYIENFGDDPCEVCEDQVGKRVRKKNIGIPVKKHPNCKCMVVQDSEPDTSKEDEAMNEDLNLEEMADMTTPIADKIVYRGFVDDRFNDDEVEYDFDETLVMICPYGDWTGGTADGKIVTQKIDDIALETLATQQDEVLVDRDHGSMKNVMERDTRAYGWAGNFIAVKNAGDFSGLYGTIKWSEEGKNLIKDRSYRFLSPAFELDKDGRPIKLISIGLTNRPNFKMAPIINSVPDDNNITITEEIMTKEDVIDIVKQLLDEQKAEVAVEAEKAEANEEKVEEAGDKAEEKAEEEIKKEEQAEVVENAYGKEEEKKEVKNEEPKAELVEEKVEEKIEEKKPVKKVKEVIKEEVLNSIPDTSSIDSKPWKKLHGEALQRWMIDNLK